MHALTTSQSGSRRLDTAYLQTTATPTGMQSAKLGQVTKYLRVIGQHELSTRDRLTDKLIASNNPVITVNNDIIMSSLVIEVISQTVIAPTVQKM